MEPRLARGGVALVASSVLHRVSIDATSPRCRAIRSTAFSGGPPRKKGPASAASNEGDSVAAGSAAVRAAS